MRKSSVLPLYRKPLKKHSTASDSSDSISKNANIVLRALGAPPRPPDLRAAVSMEPAARRCDSRRSSCYCINPLFVSTLTRCALPFSPVGMGRRAWVGDLTSVLKPTAGVDPDLGRCPVFVCGWRPTVSLFT